MPPIADLGTGPKIRDWFRMSWLFALCGSKKTLPAGRRS
jgi:hypothetical protein